MRSNFQDAQKAIRLSPNISVYDASEIEAWFELQRRRHDRRDG